MTIEPVETRFSLLPYIDVIKVSNPLSKSARKSFDYDWDDYYTISFGWFKFHRIIDL